MPVIDLKRQIAVSVEASEGEEDTTLAAADLLFCMEPELEFDATTFDRPYVREGFGSNPMFHSVMSGELRFSVEMAGNSTNVSSWTALPQWTKCLRGCGFTQSVLYALGVTSTITGGPIQHGETLTETTSGKTAVAVGQWRTGATTIYVKSPSVGGFTGNLTVTGGTSGATFTSISGGTAAQLGNAQVGYVWEPTTTGDSRTLTFHVYHDTELYKFYGARGSVEISCQARNRVIMRFTFKGIFKSVTGSSTLLDSKLTGVYNAKTPPAYINATASLTDTAGTLATTNFLFTEATLNIGNQIQMREDANGTEGWKAAVIDDRQPTAQITIEQPGATTWDGVAKMLAGTIQSFDTAWGTATYNKFRIKADHLEIATMQPGSVLQRATWDIQGRLTSGLNSGVDDLTPGRDNELIIYHL